MKKKILNFFCKYNIFHNCESYETYDRSYCTKDKSYSSTGIEVENGMWCKNCLKKTKIYTQHPNYDFKLNKFIR